MPLNLEKYAEHIETANVTLPSGDSFNVGYYPARMTMARSRKITNATNDLDREDIDPELWDQLEAMVIDVFAWWDIVDREGDPQWPVDLDHWLRVPLQARRAMLEAVNQQVRDEGKGSGSS